MEKTRKKVAIFLENIFEDTEFWYPYYRMKEEKMETIVIAPENKSYTGKNCTNANPDLIIENANADEFDALIIPGGYSPDKMRRSNKMVQFVKSMNKNDKIIAAICHAGWMLASAGIIRNRKLTSFFSIRDDMKNAGADWIDKDVVVDENLITSRYPDDLPVFCNTIISKLK